jgi:uncharacterized protein (DUF488 family)
MKLYTVGYEGRTVPEFVAILLEHGVTRVVDVRDRPWSRRRGFSAVALFETLRKAGIRYDPERGLGNPEHIRSLWKDGQLTRGKREYRALLRNGAAEQVERLAKLASIDCVALLCLEADQDKCHRSIVATEAASHRTSLEIQHL